MGASLVVFKLLKTVGEFQQVLIGGQGLFYLESQILQVEGTGFYFPDFRSSLLQRILELVLKFFQTTGVEVAQGSLQVKFVQDSEEFGFVGLNVDLIECGKSFRWVEVQYLRVISDAVIFQ